MKTIILTSTLLSISLLTVSLSAGTHMVCKGGVCIIDVSNLSSDNKIEKVQTKKNLFKKKDINQKIEMIALDKSKYSKQSHEKLNPIKNSELETIILPPEKYVMTVAEIEEYELNQIQLILPNKNIGNKIIEKSTLPTSEYFCEKHKKAVYHKETNSFECA